MVDEIRNHRNASLLLKIQLHRMFLNTGDCLSHSAPWGIENSSYANFQSMKIKTQTMDGDFRSQGANKAFLLKL